MTKEQLDLMATALAYLCDSQKRLEEAVGYVNEPIHGILLEAKVKREAAEAALRKLSHTL